MFCACEVIQSLSVVCFVVTAVYKFRFMLVNDSLTDSNHWNEGHAVTESHVFDRMLPLTFKLCTH